MCFLRQTVNNTIGNVSDYKTIKDKSPSISAEKRIKKFGYDIVLNDHIQLFPKEIHALSKYMTNDIDLSKNITFSFDNEVLSIVKQKGLFVSFLLIDQKSYLKI